MLPFRGAAAFFVQTMCNRKAEKGVAIGAFLAAVGLAFTSLIVSPDHDIAAGVLMMCAQFLTLCATIFGIDYRWNYQAKHQEP